MRKHILFLTLAVMLAAATNLHAQSDKAKQCIAIAKQFFGYLEAKDYEKCMTLCDSSLIKVLPPEKMKTNWEPYREKMGKLIKQEGETFEDKKSYFIVLLGCQFENETIDLRVAFSPEMKILGFFKSNPTSKQSYTLPSYAKPDETTTRNVTVITDTFKLGATVFLPKGKKQVPIVIMVAGSGPNDRDETIGANKPFTDIAYALAAKGIATLRYDKRTKIYPSIAASPSFSPDDEVVADALSALKLARTFPEVDSKKIFLLGHSLGAMMAPRIAEQDGHLAGVLMLAAPARPFQRVLLDQLEYLLPQQMPVDQANEKLTVIRQVVDGIDKHLYNESTTPDQLFNTPASYWDYLSKYDQVKTASSLSLPILYIQGDKDYQVMPKDYEIWRSTFASKPNVTMNFFPGLYHLFMNGKGTYTDYDVASHVNDEVVTLISKWVTEH